MNRCSTREIIALTALLSAVTLVGQPFLGQDTKPDTPPSNPQQSSEQTATIHASSEEVLLDLIARDKRGRPVRDLTANQIEVFEDGVKQQVTSFQTVEGGGPAGSSAVSSAGAAHRDNLRQVSLVSLVFERLDTEGHRNAREAALAFLHSQLRPNVYVAVFSNDARLYVLQHFTNDINLLEQAVGKATGGNTSQFPSISAGISSELERASSELQNLTAQAGVSTAGGGQPGPGVGASMAAMQMAQITYRTLRVADLLSREHEGRSSLDGILALAREERRLSGRKTIIYFTEGLRLTPALQQLFEAVVSEANRSNVSIYSVDARGLKLAEVSSGAAREVMLGAESSSHNGAFPVGGGASLGEAMAGEYGALADTRANAQDNLADLSRSTGGFLIANTNEMGSAMTRISEDIGTYYVVAYHPAEHAVDGKFHHISVKVNRPGIILQTRSGYFAAEPVAGAPVFAFEAPMLAALKAPSLPESLEYHAGALHFEHAGDSTHYQLVMEVPISDFDFKPDASRNAMHAHFSLLALVQDQEGKPVFKFSQDYPISVPSAKAESLRQSINIFTRDFRLNPGRYTLVTVAFDQETHRSSVHRSVLVVPPPGPGVSLSSVAVIKRLDSIPSTDRGHEDPLRFQDSDIVPNLGYPIKGGESVGVPVYFVVYPSAQNSEKPQMEIELSREGKTVAAGPVALPGPDPSGRIQYVGTIPAKLSPGRYSIRALIRQGTTAAEEYAFFTVAP